jgi:hypothetical protein
MTGAPQNPSENLAGISHGQWLRRRMQREIRLEVADCGDLRKAKTLLYLVYIVPIYNFIYL